MFYGHMYIGCRDALWHFPRIMIYFARVNMTSEARYIPTISERCLLVVYRYDIQILIPAQCFQYWCARHRTAGCVPDMYKHSALSEKSLALQGLGRAALCVWSTQISKSRGLTVLQVAGWSNIKSGEFASGSGMVGAMSGETVWRSHEMTPIHQIPDTDTNANLKEHRSYSWYAWVSELVAGEPNLSITSARVKSYQFTSGKKLILASHNVQEV